MISDVHKNQITGLVLAGMIGDALLVNARDRKTGEVVTLVGVALYDGDDKQTGEGFDIQPIAVMIEGDVFEQYDPPDPNTPDQFIEPGSVVEVPPSSHIAKPVPDRLAPRPWSPGGTS